MTDFVNLLEFDYEIMLIAAGFFAVIFIPFLQISHNKNVREHTSHKYRWLVLGELVFGLVLMIVFTWMVFGGKVEETFVGLVTNKNERIDTNKIVNMDIPKLLTQKDSSEFNQWDPELGRWGMDGIIRLEANVTLHKDKEVEIPNGTKIIKMITDKDYGSSDNDAFALLLSIDENPDMLVIICRGTNSFTEWVQDIEYGLSPSALLGFKGKDYYKDPMIHTGFLKTYLDIRPELLEAVREFAGSRSEPIEVFINGHSSGAAVTAIMAADIEANVKNVKSVLAYLYGSPRIGNTALKNYIDNRPHLSIHRIVNTSDIIPQFPPPIAPNAYDPENPFPYNHLGTMHGFSDNRHSFNANHYLSTYADWMQKEMEMEEKQSEEIPK